MNARFVVAVERFAFGNTLEPPVVTLRKCLLGDEVMLSLIGRSSFLEAFAGVLEGGDIIEHCFRQHSADKYKEWLADGLAQIWAAEASPGAAPVGYLVLTKPDLPVADPAESDLEVKRIYLLSRFQGAGIGRRLMEEARVYGARVGARRLLLGVYSKNSSAIAFYERLNYVVVGRRSFKVGVNNYEDLIFALSLGASGTVGDGG